MVHIYHTVMTRKKNKRLPQCCFPQACLSPIPVSTFLQHVECLRRSDGFRREYDALLEWEEKRADAFKAQTGADNAALCCEQAWAIL